MDKAANTITITLARTWEWFTAIPTTYEAGNIANLKAVASSVNVVVSRYQRSYQCYNLCDESDTMESLVWLWCTFAATVIVITSVI